MDRRKILMLALCLLAGLLAVRAWWLSLRAPTSAIPCACRATSPCGRNPFFIPEARKARERGEANYPEPSAHGIQPAWGFSISHAENVTLKDVRLETVSPDERPPYYLSHTRRVTFRRVKPAFRQ